MPVEPALRDPAVLADALFAGRPLRLAVVGYTVTRERAHPTWAEALLDGLIDAVTPARLGVVTSPTTRAGSVDRVATLTALRRDVPVLHVTCTAFVKAARPAEIAVAAERAAWSRVPRLVLPTRDAYADAGAAASNALLVLGGGPQATMDFACAARRGHRVALAVDPQLSAPPWDVAGERPVNAPRYLAAQREAWRKGDAPPWPELACVSAKQRARWAAGWDDAVGVFEGGDPWALAARVAGWLAP